ncbi:MAG: M23 family metallopeptidase [Elusimicrobia bacterium]|nr:M23 family metallopeptidase [Elusimicrobiota bacterium]
MNKAPVLVLASVLIASACAGSPAGTRGAVATPSDPPAAFAPTTPKPLPASDPFARASARMWSADAEEQAELAYMRLATDLAARSEATTFTGTLANWPVTGRITSPFGPRWGGFHNGLDIASPMYTPVLATAAGQVVLAGRPYLAYGDTAVIVIVAHGSSFATLYVHLDETRLPPVTVGQRVTPGTVVGYVGVTGWTTGPHVHFMTVSAGRAVDPRGYLP